MITAVKNKDLLEVLAERPSVFSDLKPQDLDDEQTKRFDRVMRNYEGLSQLDKDIFYLAIVKGVTKTANLMQCSTSLIFKKMKRIRKELGI